MFSEDQDEVDWLQQGVPPTSLIALHHLLRSWLLNCYCPSVTFETPNKAVDDVLQQDAFVKVNTHVLI